ncbi:MAG: sugar phosphate isomerase/epimerase [Clostridia bacterium]|nr:sugar phosphate isomerase/epimerase [Clostridia bacterium]
MRLGVITDEVSQSIRAAAEFAAHFGLEALELRSVNDRGPFAWTDGDVQEIKAVADEFGLKIAAISSPLFKCDIDDEKAYSEHIAGFRRCAEYCKILGCKMIRGFDFWKCGAPVDKRAEKYAPIVDICAEYGVYCVIENEPATHGGSPAKVLELVKAIDSPWVKLLFDPGNTPFYADGVCPYPDDYELVKGHMLHLHIKDAVRENGEGRAVCIGTGLVDYPGLIAALKRDGYDGYMCLETHYRLNGELDEKQLSLPGGSAFSAGAASASAESIVAFKRLLDM